MEENRKSPARHKATVEYLLSGKIYCGHCGGAMVGHSTTTRSQQYAYYECNAGKRLRLCDKKRERKEAIEDMVIDTTLQSILKPETAAHIAEGVVEAMKRLQQDSGVQEYQTALTGVETQIHHVVTVISGGLQSPALIEKLRELEETKAALESELRRENFIQQTALTSGDILAYLQQFAHGDKNDPTYRKKIVDTFVNSVYVYDDRWVITYNYSDKTDKEDGKRAVSEIFGFGVARSTGTMKSEIFFARGVFGISLPVTR